MTSGSSPAVAWPVAHGRSVDLASGSVLMGILNVTPDSFSDGGRHGGDASRAIEAGLQLVAEGAHIVDVGGESTRPGAQPISAQEEQDRILPVIEGLCARSDCLVSVDTYRRETAALAIAAGAHIVNDVWGAQREPGIADVAAKTGAGLCLMHNGRDRARLDDVIADQFAFLRASLSIAAKAGVPPERIVLDPGFGFAKSPRENLDLMRRLGELLALGHPLLVGTSRKRFVRAALGREDASLDVATAATSVMLRERGASIFRVHDVAASRDALALADAVLRGMDEA